jgi:hypothetical protein
LGLQHIPDTHVAEPEQLQATVPHPLLTEVPHLLSHLGRSQQSPLTHDWLLEQVKVLVPQPLVVGPQNVGVGRVGRTQQVPAPAAPDVEQPLPLPQDVELHTRDPQPLVIVVLQAVPTPPHVGSTQHAPGLVLSG